MRHYKEHIKDINRDYTSAYFTVYMADEYGVEVGYTAISVPVINMQKTLADWQLKNDCCSLCATSSSIPGKIVQYAGLPETADPCSPFHPLFSGGHSKPCSI